MCVCVSEISVVMCVFVFPHEHACVSVKRFETIQMSRALPNSHLAVRLNLQGIYVTNYFNLQL